MDANPIHSSCFDKEKLLLELLAINSESVFSTVFGLLLSVESYNLLKLFLYFKADWVLYKQNVFIRRKDVDL